MRFERPPHPDAKNGGERRTRWRPDVWGRQQRVFISRIREVAIKNPRIAARIREIPSDVAVLQLLGRVSGDTSIRFRCRRAPVVGLSHRASLPSQTAAPARRPRQEGKLNPGAKARRRPALLYWLDAVDYLANVAYGPLDPLQLLPASIVQRLAL
jgi:hypothetical protein